MSLFRRNPPPDFYLIRLLDEQAREDRQTLAMFGDALRLSCRELQKLSPDAKLGSMYYWLDKAELEKTR